MSHGAPTASPFRQPRAVWAVAFACVISFMGIGLVDPILPALSHDLHATPSQVSLLFTSYLVVTAVMMLVTNWVSSFLGAKRTMIVGLVLIVAFAALAGSTDTINGIVGFRAGWGLGNALFIATSLAVIVASASGGFAGAIILYETALGAGIAVGPLLGGVLGNISWRGPFYGVSALMAIAMIATIVLVPATPRPKEVTSPLAPLKALRHKSLIVMSLTALCYNWGFFTLLGYAPYPMHLEATQLGLVFCGWGVLVAIFSVAVAPRLQRRFGTAPSLYANMVLLAIVMTVIGVWTDSSTTVIVAVIVAGAFIGVNNTLTTQAVMTVSPVPRPVASAAYGFVRFLGGGLAPFAAGKLAEHYDIHVPFLVGAGAFLLAIPVLATGHKMLADAERPAPVATPEPSAVVEVGRVGAEVGGQPVLVAVDAGPLAATVTAKAAELATQRGAAVQVVHVSEVDVVGDDAIEAESADAARELVRVRLAELADAGVSAAGYLLRSVGDHGAVGETLAGYADRVDAQLIVVGGTGTGALARALDASGNARLLAGTDRDVLVVRPDLEDVGQH